MQCNGRHDANAHTNAYERTQERKGGEGGGDARIGAHTRSTRVPEATYPRKQSRGIMVTSNGYISGRVLGS